MNSKTARKIISKINAISREPGMEFETLRERAELCGYTYDQACLAEAWSKRTQGQFDTRTANNSKPKGGSQ